MYLFFWKLDFTIPSFNQGLLTLDRLFIHYSFNSSGLKGSWLICPVLYYGKDISASDSSTSTSWLKWSSPKSLQLKCLDLKVSVEKSDDEMSRNRTQNWFGCLDVKDFTGWSNIIRLSWKIKLALQIQNSNLVASKTLAPHTVGIDPLLSHGFCFAGNVEKPSRQLSSSTFLSIIS